MSRIDRFTPAGVGSVFSTAFGKEIAFGPTGDLFTAFNDTIYRVAPDGSVGIFVGPAAGLQGAYGIAFNDAGDLYTYDYINGQLIKFNPAGVETIISSSPVLYGIFGIAFDGAGNLYGANHARNTIDKVAPDGTVSVFEVGTAGRPLSVVVQTVPEPSSVVLVAIGLAVGLAMRLRRAGP